MNRGNTISLVLLILGIILFGYSVYQIFFLFNTPITFLFLPLTLFFISLLVSILTIIKLKKENNSKGKPLSIFFIIFSALLLITNLSIIITSPLLLLIFITTNPPTLNIFEVPLKITLVNKPPQFSRLDTYNGIPEIFIFTKEEMNTLPQICRPDYSEFGLRGPTIYINSTSKRGLLDDYPLECEKPTNCSRVNPIRINSPTTKSYNLKLYEKDNKVGNTKKLLESENDNLIIKYELSQIIIDPKIYYSTYNISTYGCIYDDFPRGIELKDLKITNPYIKQSIKERKILCVKKIDDINAYATYRQHSRETDGCVFFEATSETELTAEINLEKGKQSTIVIEQRI